LFYHTDRQNHGQDKDNESSQNQDEEEEAVHQTFSGKTIDQTMIFSKEPIADGDSDNSDDTVSLSDIPSKPFKITFSIARLLLALNKKSLFFYSSRRTNSSGGTPPFSM
jgi:hypothetical protein